MNDIKNELTTEHDIYISIGLKHPMKPTDCRDLIDSLIVDNFTLSSWGTHTKDEWIDVVNKCQEKVDSLNSQIESLKAITELAVNELKKVSRHAAVYRYPIIELMVDTTLSEIERLQNG